VTASVATPGKSQLRTQDAVAAADDSDGTEKLKYPHRLWRSSSVLLKEYRGVEYLVNEANLVHNCS